MTRSKRTARHIALEALLAVNMNDGYSNLVLNSKLKRSNISKADANLISAIFYGVLERKLTLDYIIKKYSKMKFCNISQDVLEILHIGLYQLIYMDKIPQSAAVNESVNLAKSVNKKSAAGFINGILRSFIRDDLKFRLPDKNKSLLRYLSVKYSCPENVIKIWIDSYGSETATNILKHLPGRPSLIVRVNTLKTDPYVLLNNLKDQGITAKTLEIEANALELKDTGSIEENELYKNGCFYVQDASSQICCSALCVSPGQKVLDVCAAPGGKSFTTAQIMENKGELLSCDLYPNKLKTIEHSAKVLGIDIIKTKKRDAASDKTLPNGLFDRILCDVPCSGLGVIRRKPEIRYKAFENLEKLYKLQYEILCNSAKLLKPNGILMYSTCTLNKNENNNIADRFLREHNNFTAFNLRLPKGVLKNRFEPLNQHTFFPMANNTDGFFVATFLKSDI